ncbi:MAG: prolipoprotein diacylglyceryl transferase [Candidatus Gracilibacteria bacterium]|jgi:phosphatidylglycerol:prolipoprotein diacylglycerol transferase
MPWYFNPILFNIGPLAVHWYGLMYSLGFLIGYFWLHNSKIAKKMNLSETQIDNMLIVIILGVLLGGRLGYILFYNLPYYFQNPLKILAVWEGGMSFHGGLLGVCLGLWIMSKKYKVKLLGMSDAVTAIAPIGLLLGRLGNFINGELYGRIAGSSALAQKICLHFPNDPGNCRYPSQLFESFFEGLVLFMIVYFVSKKTKRTGVVTGIFLIFYGIFRFAIEFTREPDVQIGYILKYFTEGQILSLAMVVAGALLLFMLKKKGNGPVAKE